MTSPVNEAAPPLPPRNGFGTIERKSVRSPTSPDPETRPDLHPRRSTRQASEIVNNNVVTIEVNGSSQPSSSTLTRRPVPTPPADSMLLSSVHPTPPSHPPPVPPEESLARQSSSEEVIASSSISVVSVTSGTNQSLIYSTISKSNEKTEGNSPDIILTETSSLPSNNASSHDKS